MPPNASLRVAEHHQHDDDVNIESLSSSSLIGKLDNSANNNGTTTTTNVTNQKDNKFATFSIESIIDKLLVMSVFGAILISHYGLSVLYEYTITRLGGTSTSTSPTTFVDFSPITPLIRLFGTLAACYFFLQNTIWLVAMLISIGQDDIYTLITKGSRRDNNSSSTKTMAERPATVDYNHQVQIVTGFITYLTALAVLLYSDAMSPTIPIESSYTKQIGLWIHTQLYNTMTMIEGTKHLLGLDTLVSSVKNGLDNTSYSDILFLVAAIIFTYTLFEHEWMPFLTRAKNQKLCGLRFLESIVVVPTVVLTMFVVKDPWDRLSNNTTTIDSDFVNATIRSVLYGWIVLKLIDNIVQYRTNQRTIETSVYPELFHDSIVTKKRTAADTDPTIIDYSRTELGTAEANDVWNIFGNAYDCTAFVHYHPGGVESIMLAANRDDATALFQSSHPFNMRQAKAVLEKYRIDNNDNTSNTTNDDSSSSTTTTAEKNVVYKDLVKLGHDDDVFYDIVCQRAAKVLQEDYNMHPVYDRGADYFRLFTYVVYLSVTIVSFYKYCQGSFWYTVLFAIAGSGCGAHIGHDGGHFAISSRYPWLNDMGLWAFFVLTNPITWQHEHTYGHHSFTNDAEKDPDMQPFKGAFKVRPDEKLGNHYMSSVETLKGLDKERKYFYWFLLFLFAQSSTGLCFLVPYFFVFHRSYLGCVEWSDRRQWHRTVQLIAHWIFYIVTIFLMPVLAYPNNPIMGLLQAALQMTVSGFLFSLMAQVNHISDATLNTDYVNEQRSKRHPLAQNSHAAEQVVTSRNFDMQSPVAFVYGGGLGLQIEHHLFPTMNHCHLRKIQPIIEATCKEYNVTYNKYETWYQAWTATIDYLTTIARNDVTSN